MLAASLMPSDTPHTDSNILQAMSKLSYPVLVSTKFDGIRAIKYGGRLISRTLKVIPNIHIQSYATNIPESFDLEITAENCEFNVISGMVRNESNIPSNPIIFNILDVVDDCLTYEHRLDYIESRLQDTFIPGLRFNRPVPANNPAELFDMFYWSEQNGQEGICFRTPDSPYKMGRSTLKEQYLVKLARFHTSEFQIIGFEEQMENSNPCVRDERGYAKHSSEASGMVPKNTLGALLVKDIKSNILFNIGTGFDDKLRKEIWQRRTEYVNRIGTYKYKCIGTLNKPRHPVFIGWRKKGM